MSAYFDVSTSQSLDRTGHFLLDECGKLACSALTGYLFSRCFLYINPLHGAIFCVLDSLVSRVMDIVLDKYFDIHASSNEVKATTKMLSIALSTVLLSGAVSLIGGSVGFQTGLVLGVAVFASLLLYKLGCNIAKGIKNLI